MNAPGAPYGAGPPPYGGPQPPPGFRPPAPPSDDEGNLNTLSICHFVYAGFLALAGFAGLAYAAIGMFVASSIASAPSARGAPGGPPPELLGGIFVVIGVLVMVFLWVKAAFVVYSGRCLKGRKNRTLSLVVACVCCMNLPLGTALGVFTLIVLSRASVKALYDRVAYYRG